MNRDLNCTQNEFTSTKVSKDTIYIYGTFISTLTLDQIDVIATQERMNESVGFFHDQLIYFDNDI